MMHRGLMPGLSAAIGEMARPVHAHVAAVAVAADFVAMLGAGGAVVGGGAQQWDQRGGKYTPSRSRHRSRRVASKSNSTRSNKMRAANLLSNRLRVQAWC